MSSSSIDSSAYRASVTTVNVLALQAMASLSLTTCQFHIHGNACCCCCCCHISRQYPAVSGESSIHQLVANSDHQCHHNNNVSLNHIYCTLLSSCLKTSMFHTHGISQPLPLNVAHPAQFRPTLRTCTACRGAVRYTPRCVASPAICRVYAICRGAVRRTACCVILSYSIVCSITCHMLCVQKIVVCMCVSVCASVYPSVCLSACLFHLIVTYAVAVTVVQGRRP